MAVKLKKPFFLFLLIPLSLLCIAGMFFLNDIVISVRIMELKGFLLKINREASRVDHIGMISKFKLHMQLYRNQIDEDQLNTEELKTALLLSNYKEDTRDITVKYKNFTSPVISIINFFRFFLTKPPIRTVFSDTINEQLTYAYYLERNKQYEAALEKYVQILLGKEITDEQRPNILLHQGFCLSILNRYAAAREKYQTIIREYLDEKIAMVALSLLEFQDTIEQEIEKVKQSEQDVLEKSEQLYKLIAYQEAINLLEEIETAEDTGNGKVKYLRARCYEETGDQKESVKLYQEIIQDNPASEAARSSNRRILVMSSIDETAEQLKELSLKNNELIKDESFADLAATAAKIETPQLAEIIEEQTVNAEAGVTQLGADSVPGEKLPDETASAGADRSGLAADEEFIRFINASLQAVSEEVLVRSVNTPPEPSPPPATASPSPKPTLSKTPSPTRKPVIRKTVTPVARATPLPTAPPTQAPTGTPSPAPVITSQPTGSYSIKYPDAAGHILKVENYDAGGKLITTDSYEFDKEGNPVGIISATPQPTAIPEVAESRKRFDAAGNVNRIDNYDADGQLIESYIYEYDENGNVIGAEVITP